MFFSFYNYDLNLYNPDLNRLTKNIFSAGWHMIFVLKTGNFALKDLVKKHSVSAV